MQLHLNEDGCAIDPDSQKMYFDYKKIDPHLIPCTVAPYQCSLRPLVDLWRDVEVISQHNSAATLLTSGAIAMNLHFQALVELKGGAFQLHHIHQGYATGVLCPSCLGLCTMTPTNHHQDRRVKNAHYSHQKNRTLHD